MTINHQPCRRSLTWSLCLLFFFLTACLLRSGTIRGGGGPSDLGFCCSFGSLGSSWGESFGSSLLATSASCWQTADSDSKSLLGSSELFCSSSALAPVSVRVPCFDDLRLEFSLADFLDRRDILGFLLARGSADSSRRECFGRCAGEELGVSRRGLTCASGTVRRFCCGWKSLLQ